MFRYFKYKLNDMVQFLENDGHIYRIVGYRLERGFEPEKEWTHIVYELIREFDGYMLDAKQDEIIQVVQVENEYYKITNTYGYSYPVKVKNVKKPPAITKTKEQQLDELLDAYNDYKRLASFFNDTLYEEKAKILLQKMEKVTLNYP